MNNTTTKKFEMSDGIKKVSIAMMLIGFGSLAASFALNAYVGWVDYLVGALYVTTIAVGAFFLLALTGVMQASWMTPYKRVTEAMAKFLPVSMLLMFVVFFGLHSLYEWTHQDVVMNDPILIQKIAWLNVPGFMGRMVLIFLLWILLSKKLINLGYEQDQFGYKPALTHKMIAVSSISIIVLGLSISVASWDWIMSLEPHWFSTIFGVYVFAGSFAAAVAVLTIAVIKLKDWGYLPQINENHFHDMGKWMFGMKTFWAYIWISQLLLIWYANIPEETEYYHLRWHGTWKILFYANLVINWVIPFFALMSRNAKRSPKRLLCVSVIVLVGHFLDLYLMVAPKVFEHHHASVTGFGVMQVLGLVGFLGLFLFIVARALTTQSMMPSHNDPTLDEGLHLHQ